MTRFDVLERLAAAPGWTRVGDILRAGGTALPESVKTQVCRMARYSLVVKKRLSPWEDDGRADRDTEKGIARLAWYRENGKL